MLRTVADQLKTRYKLFGFYFLQYGPVERYTNLFGSNFIFCVEIFRLRFSGVLYLMWKTLWPDQKIEFMTWSALKKWKKTLWPDQHKVWNQSLSRSKNEIFNLKKRPFFSSWEKTQNQTCWNLAYLVLIKMSLSEKKFHIKLKTSNDPNLKIWAKTLFGIRN